MNYRQRMELAVSLLHKPTDPIDKPLERRLEHELVEVKYRIALANEECRYLKTILLLDLPAIAEFLETELQATRARKIELEQSPCGRCGKLIGAHKPKMIKKCLGEV